MIGTYFSTFVYIRTRFRFALISGNMTAQSTESHRGNGDGISCKVASSLSFSRPAARAPRRACSQATSYTAVLIKIHFAFDRFLRLQNVAKIKFISIQATGGLIKGCIFLLTAGWAYNCGAYKLKSTVDPPEKRDPAAGYRPGNLTNCFLHPFNSSQLIWK